MGVLSILFPTFEGGEGGNLIVGTISLHMDFFVGIPQYVGTPTKLRMVVMQGEQIVFFTNL